MSEGEGRYTDTFATCSLNRNLRSSRSSKYFLCTFSNYIFWFCHPSLIVLLSDFIGSYLWAIKLSLCLKQSLGPFLLSGNEYVLSSNLILKAKYVFALKEYRTTWVNLSRFTFPCLNSMYFRVYSTPCWCRVRLLFSSTNASRPVQWTRGKVLYKITI